MHRSGTSALTEALVAAGAWFGEPAMAAAGTPTRPLGLFERKDFLRLTNTVLAAQGCSWHDVLAFRQAWDERMTARLQAEFSGSVLKEFADEEIAVLKDPRLCLLLPLFRPLLPELFGIMIVRHPLEVAASLNARNALPYATGVALWEIYNRYALQSLKGLPSVMVQHRRLMQQAGPCIRELCESLASLGVSGLRPRRAVHAETVKEGAYHQRAVSLTYRKLSTEQRQFWNALREARSPAEVPIQELTDASRTALEEHHAAPVIQQQHVAPRPAEMKSAAQT